MNSSDIYNNINGVCSIVQEEIEKEIKLYSW